MSQAVLRRNSEDCLWSRDNSNDIFSTKPKSKENDGKYHVFNLATLDSALKFLSSNAVKKIEFVNTDRVYFKSKEEKNTVIKDIYNVNIGSDLKIDSMDSLERLRPRKDAEAFFVQLKDFLVKPKVSYSKDNEIILTWRKKTNVLHCSFYGDGEISYYMFAPNANLHEYGETELIDENIVVKISEFINNYI